MLDRTDPKTGERIPGILKRARDGQGSNYYYWLKESRLKWVKRWQNRGHEDDCAELLVAFAPNESVLDWAAEFTDEERRELPELDVWPDRRILWVNRRGAKVQASSS